MKREKKTKPALWQSAFPNQAAKLAGARMKRDDLTTPRIRASIENKRLYREEARAFVQAAIDRGETCPVVAAIPELRHGRKYGHPISARLNEVHHMRGRIGRLLRDQRFWIALSKQGHRWVHENMDQARKHGWLCERGLWNVAP